MKQIRSEVERHIFQARVEDPFMHYLYGLLTTKKTAMDALVKSVSGFPCHWEAWKVATPSCHAVTELNV